MPHNLLLRRHDCGLRRGVLRCFFFSFLLAAAFIAYGQPNDCDGAVVICDDGPVQYTPLGPGQFDFNNTLCGTTEHQSAWYYFEFDINMPPNQDLIFTISPLTNGTDWDFAMWGPDVDCDELDAAGMVRCNFSPQGTTGLSFTPGGAFEPHLVVQPGEGFYLLVDNFDVNSTGFNIDWGGSAAQYLNCDATPQCELDADAGENIEICEGEEFTITVDIEGNLGNETITWFANPPNITQYIADTNASTTTVLIPPGNGYEFEFLVIVREDTCTVYSSMAVTIGTFQEPTFSLDQEICVNDGTLVLPTSSNEGINGTWSPTQIDPTTQSGPITAVFTPDGTTCSDTAQLTFTVIEAEIPEFDIPDSLCETDDIYVLPTTSNNGFNGTWSPNLIDPSSQAGSTIQVDFEVTDPGCYDDVSTTIDVLEGVAPIFMYDVTICESAEIIVLDETSNDGHSGTWTPSVINPVGQAGTVISATFTPDPTISACLIPYTHEWQVVEETVADFPEIGPLCDLDQPITLPTTSLDGISGTWLPATIDPASYVGQVVAVFTPDDAGENCLADVTITILIDESIEPEFDEIELCEIDDAYVLPVVSNNGVIGSWDPSFILPTDAGGSSVIATFTPNVDVCAKGTTMAISILEELVPTFSLPDWMCESDDPFELLNISSNGISGTWSVDALDPSNLGGSDVTAVFIPDLQTFACSQPLTVSVPVLATETPEFILPDVICATDDIIILPAASINGVAGDWSIPQLNPAEAINGVLTSQFIPANQLCAATYDLTINVISPPSVLDLEAIDPTDCGTDDGSIRVDAGPDIAYSIDGGNTWLDSGFFQSLPGGNYTILMRSESATTCQSQIDTVLVSPGAPAILATETDDISDCEATDGAITISATGNDLEYSIDGGNTWQSDSVFTGLLPDNYQIVVRESASPSCVTTDLAIIDAPTPVSIDSLRSAPVSDCVGNDGQIVVFGSGDNLEYSIDDGNSWQNAPNFDALASGDYRILIRDANHPNCSDETSISIDAPEIIAIDNIASIDLTDCAAADGQLEIFSSNDNIEYSIDGGQTWQDNPVFTDLSAGNYTVQIRLVGTEFCIDESSATINAPNAPTLVDVIATQLSDCGEADGTISLDVQGNDLEYSINNGATWQSNPVFTDLGAGNYTIIVRPTQFVSCEIIAQASIEALTSPEIVDISTFMDSDCNEDNGRIEVSCLGQNLEYSIDGQTWTTDSIFNNLPAGNYTISVRDALHPLCLDVESATITTIVPPSITDIQVTALSDCNLSDGALLIEADGIDLEYSIDEGATWQAENYFDNLMHGTYTVIVRLREYPSCYDELELTIDNPPCECTIEFDQITTGIDCHGDETGSISLTPSDPTADLTILWSTNATSLSIDNLSAGLYSYEIQYNDNCIVTDTIEILSPEPISFDLESFPESCEMSTDGSIIILSQSGGTGALTFQLGASASTNNQFEQLTAGYYTVIARDENGCESTSDVSVDLLPPPDVSVLGDAEVLSGDLIALFGEYSGVLADSVRWSTGNRILGNDVDIEAIAIESGVYLFEVFYGDCIESDELFIGVKEPNYYFPTAFSPNNDGINDFFYGQSSLSLSGVTYDLQVFNRWGGKVFDRKNIPINESNLGWNGYQNDQLTPNGVYVYTAVLSFEEQSITLTGEVIVTK